MIHLSQNVIFKVNITSTSQSDVYLKKNDMYLKKRKLLKKYSGYLYSSFGIKNLELYNLSIRITKMFYLTKLMQRTGQEYFPLFERLKLIQGKKYRDLLSLLDYIPPVNQEILSSTGS